MRSLATKLTLAFLIVGLTGAVLVAVLVRQTTRTAFDQFILDREQQTLVNSLQQYYQTNGSWGGVAGYLQSDFAANLPFDGSRRDFRRGGMQYTLIGSDHTVVVSNQPASVGQTYSGGDLSRAISLVVNSETVGWLVLGPFPGQWQLSGPEVAFLQRVNHAIQLSALVAAALALLLGGLLAYTLTRSLRELREATDDIARGNLGRQVKIRSKDEMGALAVSFNKMSLDLDRATQVRRQMTADIAHDLRTPLSVISGYAEALSDGKLPGNVEVYDILHQETQRLGRLVEELRVLSLADAGELPLSLQPVQPQSLLEQAAARHSVAAQQKSIAIRLEVGQGLPTVQADSERMAQVLDNLMTNAIRYTPAGGEIVLASSLAGNSVQLQVRDNGSGITPEDLPNIFDRFYRGDKARQQNGESGLGLAIAKSIVEAHRGAIAVESTPGQGTTFTILLPVAVDHPPVVS
jgi:two-component system sensor histidine kinase BaeS